MDSIEMGAMSKTAYQEPETVGEEIDPTTKEGKEVLRSYEDDILGGLLAAASFEHSEEETYPMEVARNGVVLFKFRVHPLHEEDYQKCREQRRNTHDQRHIGNERPLQRRILRHEIQRPAAKPGSREPALVTPGIGEQLFR